jgi:ABC-2 type transport system ATP-binding protein
MRLVLGLDAPTAGTAVVNGRSYRDLRAPLREVGAMLEARSIHPGCSAYHHLLAQAHTHRIPTRRVREVIEQIGLEDVARRRLGGFSLGMSQRLGVAAALLGDPAVLILDEPANGLDPEGIVWMRNLLRRLASEGRTVFLSSHLMAEIAQIADHLVVIGRGRLIADTSVEEFVRQASPQTTMRIVSEHAPVLREALVARGASVESVERDVLMVRGLTGKQIGEVALQARIVVAELMPVRISLEEAFMKMTGEAVDYHGREFEEVV